jgi:plastocyanin
MLRGPKPVVWLAVAAVAAVPLVAAGCGSDDDSSDSSSSGASSSESTTAAATGAGGTVKVSLTDFKFNPADPTVKSGEVTFDATNDGATVHSIEIEGPGEESELPSDLQPGQSGKVTVNLPPGTYEWYCPVGNHKELGMKGEITVQ